MSTGSLSASSAPTEAGGAIQPHGALLILSSDWIVRRASVNCDRLLGVHHARLVGEPLAAVFRAEAVHHLRNQLGRLGGTDGTMRLFGVRPGDDARRFDIAMRMGASEVLLEAVPAQPGMGVLLGSVGHVAARLEGRRGDELFLEGARRFRALTGCDSVALLGAAGECLASSTRGGLAAGLPLIRPAGPIPGRLLAVADIAAEPVALFPQASRNAILADAMLASLPADTAAELAVAGVRALFEVPVRIAGETWGAFIAHHRSPRPCRLEEQAAAEMFAQIFALHVQLDGRG